MGKTPVTSYRTPPSRRSVVTYMAASAAAGALLVALGVFLTRPSPERIADVIAKQQQDAMEKWEKSQTIPELEKTAPRTFDGGTSEELRLADAKGKRYLAWFSKWTKEHPNGSNVPAIPDDFEPLPKQ